MFYLGFYVEPCQNSDFVSSATIEKMSKHIIDELTVGSFDCPEIKCGFIGEIGCNFPLYGIITNTFVFCGKIFLQIKIYNEFSFQILKENRLWQVPMPKNLLEHQLVFILEEIQNHHLKS